MVLLEQFEQLTGHPKNAAKLKELVLQLAVQGKLTEAWRNQHQNVEPASELLKKIEAEKAQLVKEKKIKEDKPLEPISEKDAYYEIPENWVWCRLQQCLDVRDGTHDTPKYHTEGVPLVTSKNLSSGKLSLENVKLISLEDHDEISKRSKVEKGDILFAMIGSIGNPVMVDIEPNFSIKNVALFKYYLKETPIPAYLLLYLQFAQQRMKEAATGAVQSFVSLGDLRRFLLPLPPLAEQEAIVVRVEELMQKIEELEKGTLERIQLQKRLGEAALQALTTAPADELEQQWLFLKEHFQLLFTQEANVKKLRETILQLAVQGKLTTAWRQQNPTVQPAAQLLQQIQAEQAQLVKEKKIKKEKPLEPIAESEVPYELPEGWVWCRLSNIIEDTDAGKSPQCDNRPAEPNEFGFIKTTAIQSLNFLPKENKAVLKDEHISLAYEIKAGDILITRAGPRNRVGIVCAVTATRDKLLLSDKTVRIKPIQGNFLNSRFLAITLSTGASGDYLETKKSGMADSQVNITQDNIKLTPVALPPLAEQEAIVAKVDQLMQLCEALENQLKQSNQQSEALMQAVVHAALQPQEEPVLEA
ncbi:restriction endonuclease subunit S [Rufibacter ruber]|uniref:restriction endonuclease subunit S n=1 Tax=Rufibacter ruber TaxID=1783499 RepID=UPI00082E5C95|nr:restriction endonuclease subunit S [Rufibacter ruber]